MTDNNNKTELNNCALSMEELEMVTGGTDTIEVTNYFNYNNNNGSGGGGGEGDGDGQTDYHAGGGRIRIW